MNNNKLNYNKMKKFFYLIICLIFLVSCNDSPRQLKLIDTPEFYADDNEDFYIVKVINDSMGFAVDANSWIYDDYEPECVIIANELLYDDKSVWGNSFGEWRLIGTWKGNRKTYPVIKFYEFDSIEFIQHIKEERHMDSLMRETLGEDFYNTYKKWK